jgi:SAM-dependent methyltransferase
MGRLARPKGDSMETDETTRAFIRERYASIATGRPLPVSASCCSSTELSSFVEQGYTEMEGYAKEADLSLGCGIPTAHAGLRPGEVVLDLGSGAGNDAFIASRAVGASGKVIGVDMTSAMIAKADENAAKLGAKNVEFRLGEIEALPVDDDSVDVVISNCVVNLVPDKAKAFSEIHRVLKPGGRFSVSDIVLDGELPEPVRRSAEMWAGCVSGALPKDEYHANARHAGFDLVVEKERVIEIPEEIVSAALAGAVLDRPVRILSITLAGRRTS